MMDANFKKALRWEYLGALLIVIAFFIFDYFPKLVEIRQMRQVITVSQANIDSLSKTEMEKQKQRYEADLSRVQEGFALIRQATEMAKQKIMQEKNVALITLEIEDIAGASKIELESVTPLTAKAKEKGDFEILPIAIGIKSEYALLIDFLDRIESSSRLMAVQNLTIHKDEIHYPKLDVSLTFHILFDSSKQNKTSQGN